MNTIYDQALEDVIMGDTVMLPDGSVVSDASKKAADTVALVSTGDFDIHIFGEPAVPVLALMVTDLSTGQSIPVPEGRFTVLLARALDVALAAGIVVGRSGAVDGHMVATARRA